MAKGNKDFNTCKVFLGQQDRTALLTVLTYFIEADDLPEPVLGKYAKNIREKILTYSQPFTRKGEKKYRITFSEPEAALLIKFFVIFSKAFIFDDDAPDASSV